MRVLSFIAGIVFCVTSLAQTAAIDLGKLTRESSNKGTAVSLSGKLISLMNGGLIWAPKNYIRTGRGMDSEMGALSRPGMKIDFDIGFLGGAHIGDHNKTQFSSHYDTVINGYRTCIGVKMNGIVKELVVTTYGTKEYQGKPDAFPANFWAFVKGEDDIREILSIVFSYKPKKL